MNDPLPTSVPPLDPTGSNWAIFSMCFQEAMEASQKWGHFTSKSKCPVMADPVKPMDDEKKAIAEWTQDETIAKYLLSQQLPDSTAIHLKSLTSAKECWNKVTTKFSVNSQYMETNMLTAFSKMHCPHGRDVRQFLGQMRMKHEELVAVGVTMTQKEHRSAIIKAIPDEMSKFASGLLTAVHVLSPSTNIDPNLLIDHISKEANHLAAWHKCNGAPSSKGKQPQSQDEAMAATQGDVFLNAANGQQFPAVGTGSMVVSVPNGSGKSELTLKNVLHAPSISYTLVSLRALDSLGYRIAISGGHLEIQSGTGECLVSITCTLHGLYCVAHECEGRYTVEVISIMELHRCMGHIVPASADKLIEDWLITRIALNPNSQEEHCNVCLYAHATHQPIPKMRISPQAKNFGDRIHTNVWGPTPVTT
ncbi:hypothetical protein H4582DRAFT_2089143 [Lactarius indigo]|nr:hypothetical protein H4582DRAFT_2089143 [Lactarius indigo]